VSQITHSRLNLSLRGADNPEQNGRGPTGYAMNRVARGGRCRWSCRVDTYLSGGFDSAAINSHFQGALPLGPL
jgi:hypothetical protein